MEENPYRLCHTIFITAYTCVLDGFPWNNKRKGWVRDSRNASHCVSDRFDTFARGNIFITSFDQEAICQQQTLHEQKKCSRCSLLTPEPGAGFCGGAGPDWWSQDSPLHRRAEDSNVQVTTQRMEPLAVWLHAISRPVSGSSWQAGCAGTAKQGLTSVRCELRTRVFACDFFKWEKCHPNFSYHAR